MAMSLPTPFSFCGPKKRRQKARHEDRWNERGRRLTATPARPSVEDVAKRAEQDKRLKELKETAKKLEAELSQRPMAMGLQTVAGKDIAVHIRGSVHALGEVVPRGFLKLSDRRNVRSRSHASGSR